jgi:hypothetical protein
MTISPAAIRVSVSLRTSTLPTFSLRRYPTDSVPICRMRIR